MNSVLIKLLENIRRLDLRRPEWFDAVPSDVIERVYNGYGPDKWSETWREIVTWVYRYYRELAVIHDMQFEMSCGTREGWQQTLDDWKANSSILLDDRYPLRKFWLAPVRAWAWAKLRASYRALQLGSWGAWQEAARRRERQGGEG